MGAINGEGDIVSGVFQLGANNNQDNPYWDQAAPNGGFNYATGKGLAGNNDYQFLKWLDEQSRKGLSTTQLRQQKAARAVSSGYWDVLNMSDAEALHEMSFYGKSVNMINKYAVTAPISNSFMTEIENTVRRNVTTGRLGGSAVNNKYLPQSDTKAYLNASQNFENEVLLRMAYRYNIDIPKGFFNSAGQMKSTEEMTIGQKLPGETEFMANVYRAHVYATQGSAKGKELDKSYQSKYSTGIQLAKEKAAAGAPYNAKLYQSLGIPGNNWNDYVKYLQTSGAASYMFTTFQSEVRVSASEAERKFNNVFPASSIREFVKADMPNNVVGWALGNYDDNIGMTQAYSEYNYTQTTNKMDNPMLSIDRLRGEEANGYGPAMFMSRMMDNAKVWRETDFDAVFGKNVWKNSTDGGPGDMSVAVKSFYENEFPDKVNIVGSKDPLMDFKKYFYGDAGKDIFESNFINMYSYLDNDFGINDMSSRAISGALNSANAFFAKNIDTIDVIGSITNTMNFIKDTVGNVGEAILGGVGAVVDFGDDIIHGKNIAKSTGNLFFKMGEELIWDPIEQTYYDYKEWDAKQEELLNYDPGASMIKEPGSNVTSPYDETDTGVVDQSGDNVNEDGSTASGGGTSTGSGGGGMATTGAAGGVLENLRRMLGIIGDSSDDKKIIDELVNPGGDLPKLADSVFRPEQRDAQGNVSQEAFTMQDLMSQQAQVAEQGYDIGEREALSAKSRRELAGLARQQGMAAGAASGGIRGASTGAQARSLMEKAMMKQADVTTEMDKASISRKDSARQQLANLAQGVYGFDITREEEARKRRSATVLGIENLQQQAANAAAQLRLAESD